MSHEETIQPILDTYREWVATLGGYMKSAAELLEGLYADQDRMIEQLRRVFAKRHSLRRVDFDLAFGRAIEQRRQTRRDLLSMAEAYRASREAVLREIQDAFAGDLAQTAQAWPALKERLLCEEDGGVTEVAAALRCVHMEQQQLTTAIAGLLSRSEKLKVQDLRTVANRLADTRSGKSAELAALLGMCDAAARAAGQNWRRLAG
jgi:hypothetical protein